MTRAKKTKSPKAQPNLQQQFLALSPVDQQGVTNFFNAHNIAHFIYDGLSEDAQKYVTYCIRLSQQADKIEKENSAQGIIKLRPLRTDTERCIKCVLLCLT